MGVDNLNEVVFDHGRLQIIFARLSNGVGIVWQGRGKSTCFTWEEAELLKEWLDAYGREKAGIVGGAQHHRPDGSPDGEGGAEGSELPNQNHDTASEEGQESERLMGNDGKFDERLQRMIVLTRYTHSDARAIPDHTQTVEHYITRLDFSYGDPHELVEMEAIYKQLHEVEQRLLALSIRMAIRFRG